MPARWPAHKWLAPLRALAGMGVQPNRRGRGTVFAMKFAGMNLHQERMMDPIPYDVREEDIDEVLSAYESVGGSWTADARHAARDHVMRHVLDIDDAVRTTPEERRVLPRGDGSGSIGDRPDENSPRREMALAAIEDVLIRDGFIEVGRREQRIFPVTGRRD